MRALALVGAVCWAGMATGRDPVPLADFARKAEYESVRISPTGEYLAVAAPAGDQTALGIVDLENMRLSGALRFARGEHVASYAWVSPTRVIVSIANRGGPLDQPRLTGELYAMDADGSRKAYLFGYRGGRDIGSNLKRGTHAQAWAFVEHPLPREHGAALISVWPWHRSDRFHPLIERIDVHSGRRTREGVLPAYAPIDIAADDAGRVRLAAGLDDKGVQRLFAPDGEGWRMLDHPGGPPESVSVHRASPDGSKVFLTTGDATGRSCVREFVPARGALAERICSDSPRFGAPVFALDGDQLIGTTVENGLPEWHFFDESHPDARMLRTLAKTFAGERVTVTSHTLDGRSLVVRVDGGTNPGEFFLVDRQTRKGRFLLARRPWIDPRAMAPVEAVRYETRDGAAIHGYLTRPAGARRSGLPLVVMPHGGPHGVRDFWEWDGWAQAMASRGYAVLQPNYRGSGGYGVLHERAGYRKWGTLMQDDLTDGVNWAVRQGIADPGRICIVGASYGGYAALMSATREPDLYRCAVGFAGAYDLAAQASDSDIDHSLMGRLYLERVLGDEAAMAAQSPVAHVARLKAAVLIAHGTADRRVPFSQARLLRKALERHGKPYEWLEFAGEEHGFYDDDNHALFLERLIGFLDRHIGERRPAAPAD